MKQAVILAGGKGTRLKDRLNGRPKPLVDIDGRPLLARQLDLLAASGFDEAVILVNHAADQIRAFCAENDPGLRVRIVDDGEPRGTAGAVLATLDILGDQMLIVYGDTLLDIDLDRFWSAHQRARPDATLFLHPNDHPHDSDLVDVDDDGVVQGFHSYPHDPDRFLPNLVNAALYVVEKSALQPYRDAPPPLDFAKDLFPRMVREGRILRGYVTFEYIKDIGTPARLDKALGHLRSGVVSRARLTAPQRAVFLDRDGTLNVSRGYVRTPGELTLFDGVPAAVKRLNDAEFRTVLVTNQPVLARGEASVETMRQIHAKLETELGRGGAFLDSILLCPHHPDSGFPGEVAALKVECDCRKPGTALIEQARRNLNIDLARSWFIGDTSVDMLAARKAGVRSILVRTGEGGRDGRHPVSPDIAVDDLPAAVDFITRGKSRVEAMMANFADGLAGGDVVLVGGPARSGKSTVAQVLAWMLVDGGRDAAVLGLDRFLLGRENRPSEGGVLARYDMAEASTLLAPWLATRDEVELALPWYDRRAHRRHPTRDTLRLRPDTILIVEGVPALGLALHTDRRIHRIGVTAGETERRRRVVDDLVDRGATPDQADAMYQARMRDETPVIAALAKPGDFPLTLDAS